MRWIKQNCPICNGSGKAWISHNCPSGYKYKTCDHEELDEVIYGKLAEVQKEILALKKQEEYINKTICLRIAGDTKD